MGARGQGGKRTGKVHLSEFLLFEETGEGKKKEGNTTVSIQKRYKKRADAISCFEKGITKGKKKGGESFRSAIGREERHRRFSPQRFDARQEEGKRKKRGSLRLKILFLPLIKGGKTISLAVSRTGQLEFFVIDIPTRSEERIRGKRKGKMSSVVAVKNSDMRLIIFM